jgi:hypothetical protein
MGKIIVSENVSLDGVIQDPAGDEGFRLRGWVGRVGDKGREEAANVLLDEALGTEALLLGRRSYEFFATVAIPEWQAARPATRSPWTLSTSALSVTASPSSPTSPSETPSHRRRYTHRGMMRRLRYCNDR